MDYPYPDPRMLPDTEKRKNLVPMRRIESLGGKIGMAIPYLAIMELPQELRAFQTLWLLSGRLFSRSI